MNNITAVILTGGKSKRMKQDKALVKINNISLLENQITLLKPIFNNLLISANKQYNTDYKLISDVYKDKGPIAGIYSILKKIDTKKAFILAVDMPYITSEIIKKLVNSSNKFEITTPVINGKIEPTCAIYSKKCLNIILQQIENNNFKLTDLIKKCNTNYVEFEPEKLKYFKNLNTPTDLP